MFRLPIDAESFPLGKGPHGHAGPFSRVYPFYLRAF